MRICVITGGTGGIGLHLCEGFQRAGYAVTALDVEQHKALPDGIGFIQTDLRQAEAVSEAFRRVTERHGAVHVLVNNAALAHFHKPVTEMTADEFDNACAARSCARRPSSRPTRGRITGASSISPPPAGTRTKRDGRPTALQKGALSPSRTRWPSPCAPHRSRPTP